MVPTHDVGIKGKDVLIRTFPLPTSHSLSYCVGFQTLPEKGFRFNKTLMAESSYLISEVLLKTPRSSMAIVGALESRELEGEGNVDKGSL